MNGPGGGEAAGDAVFCRRAGSVCMIRKDLETGVHAGGADARRPAYAVGW